MADFRDATISAFVGMEKSITTMRYLTLLAARMDQDLTVVRNGDGTASLVFDSIDDLNTQCFLILQAEERMQALVKEFNACIEVWSKGEANANVQG